MKKVILIILSLLLFTCEDPNAVEDENTSWVFVANEGNFGASNGTISMIDDFGNIYKTDEIISNKPNPSIIARYTKNGNEYNII